MGGWCAMARSTWACSTRASFVCAYRSAALARGGRTRAHDERDARRCAQGHNPPPRPHPPTTTGYPHPERYTQKVSPMCSVQSVTYVHARSDLACATPGLLSLDRLLAEEQRPGED